MRSVWIAAAALLATSTLVLAQPTDVTSYSLLAQQEIRAKNLEVVSGNVGVNDPGGALRSTKDLFGPQSVVVAANVRFRDHAVCDALFAFTAKGDGPSCGPAMIPQLPLTDDLAGSCGFPVSPPACDPAQDVHLRPGAGTLTLPPGTYGDLLITGNGSHTGTVRLAGGSYVFCSIKIARNGRLDFAGPSDVFVTGDVLAVSNGAQVEPAPGSSLSATDVHLVVAGDKVRFSRGAVVRLLLCAPNALLELAGGSDLTGRFVADQVKAFGTTITGVGGGPGTTTTTIIGTSTTQTSTSTTTSTTTGGVCGNGIREDGEQCDGSDLGGATCPGGSPGGAFPACTETCLLDFSPCPAVSTTTSSSSSTVMVSTSTVTTTTTTSTMPAVCGNGVREDGEQCDGADIGDATCPPDGSPGGAFPTCTVDCVLDFSSCPNVSTTTTTSTSSTTSSTTPSTSTSSTISTSTSTSSTTSSTTPSTSTSSTSSTSTSTSSTTSTSTTTSSTTSTQPAPAGTVLRFTTGAPSGDCGVAKAGGAGGSVVKTLHCGGLNLGHGSGTVPEGPTPAGADTFFNTACAGGTCTVSARTAAETGSSRDCSDTGCDFGPYLPIANPATPALSTCVHNTFATPGNGTLDATTGEFDGAVPLSSQTTVTGNVTSPCPKCISNVCDPTWVAAGNVQSPDVNQACTATNASGDTYDCRPPQAPYSGVLAPFPVTLSPIGTGQSTLTGLTPCPGQTTNGCFGQPTCDYIEENGAPAGMLSPGAHGATLASAFCIPATGNVLVDGSAGLPGPGATSLPGTLELLP